MAEPGGGPPRSDDGPEERHVPVLRERTVALLAPALVEPGSVVVDATVGLGGHSEALLSTAPEATLVGLDRDPQALDLARRRLAPFGERVRLVHAVYDAIPQVLAGLGIPAAHGVLFDLGVSSLQLDEVGRGFAYAVDAPLDMRMDPGAPVTAADVVNTYDVDQLTRVLRDYGEERFAARIARAIVRERSRQPFTTSARLVDVIRSSVPAATRRVGGHPAKRTFQALRIEVNGELEVLSHAVPAAVDTLAVGGRIVVLAYHSLEDRIVKRVLGAGARGTAPPGLPVEPAEHAPRLRLLTRGAETASQEEVTRNPRAASVRLRAAERVRPGAITPAVPPDHRGAARSSRRSRWGSGTGGDAA
jgi:16S rRNA (cytosine1402-N4)-methyltransferase